MKESNSWYSAFRLLFSPLFHLIFHPTIVGKEKIPEEGAFLLVGNHKHALDPILVDVCTKRVVHALAKKELFDGPFGFFFRLIGAIPVDLEAKKNPKALQSGLEVLQNGGIVNISPEAERNYTSEILLPFKKGAVIMSQETQTPILPYCIVGDYKFRSGGLKIVFGEPMMVGKDEPIEQANERLYEAIKTLLLENR